MSLTHIGAISWMLFLLMGYLAGFYIGADGWVFAKDFTSKHPKHWKYSQPCHPVRMSSFSLP